MEKKRVPLVQPPAAPEAGRQVKTDEPSRTAGPKEAPADESIMANRTPKAEMKKDKLGAAGKITPPAAKPQSRARSDFDAIGKYKAKSSLAPALESYSKEYEEQVPFDRHVYAGRDRFEHIDTNPVKVVTEEPVSTFSIDVDTASYAFVRRALNQGHLPQKDAVRVEELINYFDYDYESPLDTDAPFKPTVALYPTPWNPATRLLHIGIKGHEIQSRVRPRANLVFLVDVSGSMSSPDKLPLLINSLKMLVEELEAEDTVAIAVYAGSAGTVLEPTKIRAKGKIIAALERLRAGGSTAGGEGIKLAYSLAESGFDPEAVNRVILATDGDFNVGIRNPEELKSFVERKRDTGIYLSVLGFGQGNYNDLLMQKLAQNGNGNAAYIDTLNEARKVLVDEAGSTLFTIAKDVKIQIEFNPERVSEYRLIGYESRMLRREDFNNDKVDAGDVGAGHSVTAIYEITPAGSAGAMVDPLRYKKAPAPDKGAKGEYAFLKIRYKLPHESESRLITTPVDATVELSDIDKAGDDIRFAAAVAAFGQILKGGRYTKLFDYDDVITLAEPARGRDRFGYRSEFLNLARLAMTASTMGSR
jgi:Ca-activated chloride channel family protein